MHSTAAISRFHLLSSPSLIVRIWPCTDCVPRSTTPFDAELLTGENSAIHLPEPSPLLLPTSSTSFLIEGSWSDFATMSRWPMPSYLMKAPTRAMTNFPVLLDGMAVAMSIFALLSFTTRIVRVSPGLFSGPMNM